VRGETSTRVLSEHAVLQRRLGKRGIRVGLARHRAAAHRVEHHFVAHSRADQLCIDDLAVSPHGAQGEEGDQGVDAVGRPAGNIDCDAHDLVISLPDFLPQPPTRSCANTCSRIATPTLNAHMHSSNSNNNETNDVPTAPTVTTTNHRDSRVCFAQALRMPLSTTSLLHTLNSFNASDSRSLRQPHSAVDRIAAAPGLRSSTSRSLLEFTCGTNHGRQTDVT
jgi:hypothetical protein